MWHPNIITITTGQGKSKSCRSKWDTKKGYQKNPVPQVNGNYGWGEDTIRILSPIQCARRTCPELQYFQMDMVKRLLNEKVEGVGIHTLIIWKYQFRCHTSHKSYSQPGGRISLPECTIWVNLQSLQKICASIRSIFQIGAYRCTISKFNKIKSSYTEPNLLSMSYSKK